ncbi:coiled-coil domain-containing protein 18 isoform X2 [Octopus bimaculoides]|nr:coiled-coil domain-containing protein 18 isoform X2 [Octopus bimaculoides]
MELRLKEVTHRLQETEKSLANIYLMEQQDLKEKVFGVDNLSQDFWYKNSLDQIRWNDSNSNVSEQSTPTDSLGMAFKNDDMVASTPKKHNKKSNEPIKNKYQEKLDLLQTELKIQDQSLREAEERYEKAQKNAADANSEKENLQKTIHNLKDEINQIKQRNLIEKEDTRKHFESYKRNIEEKCHLLESKILNLNKERDNLLQNIHELESNLKKYENQIRKIHDKNEQEIQEKHSLIDENALLKRELKSAKFTASVIESTSSELENMRQENCHLQYRIQLKTQQVKDNVAEKESIKEILREFVCLIKDGSSSNSESNPPQHVTKPEQNDSGILSWRPDCQQPPSKVVSEFEALLQISVPTACSSLLTDIQNKFADKEAKIQQLQAFNQSLAASKEEWLKVENQEADNYKRKITELSESNNYLSKQLDELKENFQSVKYQLAESEAKAENLDFCISQRNTQLVELQEELNNKENNICQLEKKLREKSHEIVTLDAQLSERMRDFNEQFNKYQQFEDELRSCEAKLDQTQAECSNYRQEMEDIKKEKEKDLQLYLKQFKEKDKLIESLQRKSDEQQVVMEDLLKQVDILSGELFTKSESFKDLQYQEQETSQKLIQKNEELENMQKQLDCQSSESKNCINQMEKTIESFKAQMSCYIKDAQKNNSQYLAELALKNSKEQSLVNQIKQLEQSLKEKEQQCNNLQQTHEENQSMLDKSYELISQLKKSQVSTLKEISRHEKHIVIERSKRMELELILKNKCDQLQKLTRESNTDIKKLQDTVRDLQQAKDNLTEHSCNITSQLQKELQVGENRNTHLNTLQEQYNKKNEELQQLINSVDKMKEQIKFQEEQIALTTKENNNLHQVVAALQAKVSNQNFEKQESKRNIENLEYNLKAKEELLEDTRDAIKKLQTELNLKKEENDDLQSTIREQHLQLEERAQKVAELVKSMSDYRIEMENRVKDGKNLLDQEQIDIKNKMKQIVQYREQYQKTVEGLQNTTLLLEAKSQTCHKIELELASKNALIENSAKTIQNQTLKEKELVEYKAEITQELRLAREQLQNQTADFMLVRSQQTKLRHENDKLLQKIETLTATLNTKQTEISKLTENVSILRLEKIKSESKMSTEIKQLQQEIKMEQQTHSMELERLKETNLLLQKNKEDVSTKLNESNKKHLKAVTQHEKDLNSLKASLHLLEDEVKVQKEAVISGNETIVLKDIEISKLKSDLTNMEKILLSLKFLQFGQNKVPQFQNQETHDSNKYQAENESSLTSESHKEIIAILENAETSVDNEPKFYPGFSTVSNDVEKNTEAKSSDVQHTETNEERDIDRQK